MGRTAQSVRWAAGCILTSLVLVDCGANPTTPSATTPPPPAFRHFDSEELSFDYPGTWNAGRFSVVSSFSSVIVYLSTAPLVDPCDRTADGIACVRNAVSGLGPDGVFVEWSHQSFPGWTFDPTKGRPTRVGGRLTALGAGDVTAEVHPATTIRTDQAKRSRVMAPSVWMSARTCRVRELQRYP